MWIIIDKPIGVSSTYITSKIKRMAGKNKKVGHAGTLDPLATGILPIAIGRTTSLIQFLMHQTKEYEFTVKWGSETSTDDAEGHVTNTSMIIPSRADLLSAIPRFAGEIMQTPPSYSAIKISGKPAYKMARAGNPVEIPERIAKICGIELLCADNESATMRVECHSGTYIRSIARDIARHLGACGHVSSLRRTRVGPFIEKNTVAVDFLQSSDYNDFHKVCFSPEAVLDDIPTYTVSEGQAKLLWNGMQIPCDACDADHVSCFCGGDLVAIATVKDLLAHPRICFINKENNDVDQ